MWNRSGQKKPTNGEDGDYTFLGKGVDFKGVVHFDGTVRIDGRLEGEIHTKGTLIIGEHAVIKGIITTGTLVSGGKLQANITAIEKVQLLKTAILIGPVSVLLDGGRGPLPGHVRHGRGHVGGSRTSGP
jgi:cytoskeletal protein CcmA (bactofilin family)